MGALHQGHLSLIAEARQRADFVVVSIFVNPTQFGPNEDLARYPRTLEQDLDQCERAQAHLVFAPETTAMYPAGEETRVRVGATSQPLCGAHRPGHFEGVATVVVKLFALVGPSVAMFGRKDYQQLQVIRRVVSDLMLPIEVVGAATVREADGLAMSSRNRFLAEADRARARTIPQALSEAVRAFAGGERSVARFRALVLGPVSAAASSVDYVELTDPDTLVACPADATAGDRALLAVAARIGTTRLIDNVVLGEAEAPCAPGSADHSLDQRG